MNRDEIKPGETVRIYQKGQPAFQGIVIARHGGSGPSATFVVRAILESLGVEKIYPLNSPLITKIERIKSGKARRAKLYYLRKKIGKEARVKEVRKSEKTRPKTKTNQKVKNSKNKSRESLKR